MIFVRVVRIAICGDWVLHVVLPLTSCDSALRFSVFTSVQLRISPFLGGGAVLLRLRGNLLIYLKMSISRLLWGDRWKLHGEIQRHAIVTTYMVITNDRCEDSLV